MWLFLCFLEKGGGKVRVPKIKVLNLYAGISGNRKFWRNVDVTAVENNGTIAGIYKKFFPNDTVIVGDAHSFLLEHYKEFDFIWSSPPCPTHSRMRKSFLPRGKTKPAYPDMTLYQEIIFLKHHAVTPWIVENVKPYYEPLIEPQYLGRHCFWCNFKVKPVNFTLQGDLIQGSKIKDLEVNKGFDLSFVKGLGKRKDQVLKNCVNSKLGNHIFTCAFPNRGKK